MAEFINKKKQFHKHETKNGRSGNNFPKNISNTKCFRICFRIPYLVEK